MQLTRSLALVLLLSGVSVCRAASHPRALTTAATEARNETAAPSFSEQVREAHRITSFLLDALLLNNAQWHAVQAYTVAEHEALALAETTAAAAQVQQRYLLALRQVLAASQLAAYVALRQQLANTVLPLDGTEVALR